MSNISNPVEQAPKINDEFEEVTAESLERQVHGGDGQQRRETRHDKRRGAQRATDDLD